MCNEDYLQPVLHQELSMQACMMRDVLPGLAIRGEGKAHLGQAEGQKGLPGRHSTHGLESSLPECPPYNVHHCGSDPAVIMMR